MKSARNDSNALTVNSTALESGANRVVFFSAATFGSRFFFDFQKRFAASIIQNS